MKKIYFSALLFIVGILARAQFVGQYSLHDGGVDVQSSALLVLPNHEFMVFYLGGLIKGVWKEQDKNTITLTEIKLSEDPVLVYAKKDAEKGKMVKFDVTYLSEAHAFIRFSKDETFIDELKPIFNNFPNCMKPSYIITKKEGEFNFVNISIPVNPEFGKFEIQYPYKVLNYVFPIDKQYNQITFANNKDARKELFQLNLSKKGNDYFIENYGEKRKTERKDLDKESLAEIDKAKSYIKTVENGGGAQTKIKYIEKPGEIVYKFNPKPLFKSFCEGDDLDSPEPDYDTTALELKSIDRENGIYSISNYNENDIKTDEFVVAKKSSLNQKDFLKAEKQVSDHDGYEIKITFTKDGITKFRELLKNNPRKPVAFIIDHKIISYYYFTDSSTAIIGNGLPEKELDNIISKINSLR